MNSVVSQLIAKLNLQPHPEGGYYRETYRSQTNSGAPPRSLSTAIYYLLVGDNFSEMHKLTADEIFHFYLGHPIEMLQLWPNGQSKLVRLGQNIDAGEEVQVLVPAGVWFGSRLADSDGKHDRYALMGTTVAPGFDFADYQSGKRDQLIAQYPDCASMISALTHK